MVEKIRNISNRSLEYLFLLTILLFPISIALRNILLGLLLIFYLFNKIINKDFSIPKTFLNKYILIFFVFSLLSFINTNNISASLDTLLSPIFRYIAFFIIAYELIDIEKINKYLNILIGGGLFLLIGGLYIDYFSGDSFFYRANGFGATSALLIIFFSNLFFNYKGKMYRVIAIIGFVLSGNALILSYSRGATMGLVFAVVVTVSIYLFKNLSSKINKKRVLFIITSIIIIILLITPFILPDRLIDRFKNTNLNINTNVRILMWRTTIEMIKEYPILGAGLGTFNYYFLHYVDNVFEEAVLHQSNRGHEKPHNLYLFIAAEQGIPSLLIYLSMFFLSVKLALIKFLKNNDIINNLISLSLLGFLAQVFAHSFVDTSVLYGQVGVYVILFLVFTLKNSNFLIERGRFCEN